MSAELIRLPMLNDFLRRAGLMVRAADFKDGLRCGKILSEREELNQLRRLDDGLADSQGFFSPSSDFIACVSLGNFSIALVVLSAWPLLSGSSSLSFLGSWPPSCLSAAVVPPRLATEGSWDDG